MTKFVYNITKVRFLSNEELERSDKCYGDLSLILRHLTHLINCHLTAQEGKRLKKALKFLSIRCMRDFYEEFFFNFPRVKAFSCVLADTSYVRNRQISKVTRGTDFLENHYTKESEFNQEILFCIFIFLCYLWLRLPFLF